MIRGSACLGWFLVALPVHAWAADILLLQQSVLPDETGPALLQLDRERVALAQARKDKQKTYVVEVTLIGHPALVVTLRCQDLGGARQILDALRPGALPSLDVSGRCRF